MNNPIIHIPHDLLPESKTWTIGKIYRVKLVLKQVSAYEDGTDFEIVDANSLESEDKGRRYFTTEAGILKR